MEFESNKFVSRITDGDSMGNFFKVYCHLASENSVDSEPKECSEVSIQADSATLREIAAFLIESAEKLENVPPGAFVHHHFQDEKKSWSEEFPDIIAVSP